MRIRLALLAVWWLVGSSRAAEKEAHPPAPGEFRAGDRWSVLGDSVTQGAANRVYHQWIELFYLTRFPGRPLEVSNHGVSGESVNHALGRFGWDIAPRRPTVTTLLFGLNDINRSLYDTTPETPARLEQRRQRLDAFSTNVHALVRSLQEMGSRVILITPTLFEENGASSTTNLPGCNAALADCARRLREIAADRDVALVDLHGPLSRLDAAQQARDRRFSLIAEDRVHPLPSTHLLMAHLFLKAQGVSGEVARVSIAADRGEVVAVTNAQVDALRVAPTRDEVAFTCREYALPFPVDATLQPALALLPFTDELNREIFQITGLAPGRYRLTIDGVAICEYDAEALARGVNLATEGNTPQYRQAERVAALLAEKQQRDVLLRVIVLMEKNLPSTIPRPVSEEMARPLIEQRLAASQGQSSGVFFQRMAEVYLAAKPDEAKLPARIAELMLAARAAAEPKPHDFALKQILPASASAP